MPLDLPAIVARYRAALPENWSAPGNGGPTMRVIWSQADVADLLAEVARLTAGVAAKDAEIAALKAGPVVEWRKMLDGRTAEVTTWAFDAGDASLRVAEKSWRTRSFPGWKGEKPGWAVVFGRKYVASSGPETGDAGKAACEAAYRRVCGL